MVYNWKFSWPLVLIICLFFCSCDNGDDDIFIGARSNIVGSWDIEVTLDEVRADTIYSTSTFETEYTFFEDGIATSPNPFTGPDPEFTWFYTYDPEFVVINQLVDENRYIVRECEVLENNSDTQLWVYKAPDITGKVDFWRNTWSMKKRN